MTPLTSRSRLTSAPLCLLLASLAKCATAELDGCSRTRPCAYNGTCDVNTGFCACLVGYGGPLCEELLYPACRKTTEYSHHGFPPAMRCYHQGARSCDCLRQCNERPSIHRMGEMLNCFDRVGVSVEDQLSTFPEESEEAKFYEGFNEWGAEHPWQRSEMVTMPRGMQKLVPNSRCQEGCSGEGECVDGGSCQCFGGFSGAGCEMYVGESACANGCSGRGRCIRGVCSCEMGWFGLDCSVDLSQTASLPGGGGPVVMDDPPVIRDFHQPAFASVPRRSGDAALQLDPTRYVRSRPRIYVYELPPWLGLGHEVDAMPGRVGLDSIYSAPKLFLWQLLHDKAVRTHDPYEANLFYVPAYEYAFSGNGDAPHPHVRRVIQFLKANYAPFWERNQGADHIFWAAGDPGACPIPADLKRLLWIVHFGLTNYTVLRPDEAKPDDSCFYPEHGVVAPPSDDRTEAYARLTYGSGALKEERTTTLFFAGTIGLQFPLYSMGVRQAIYNLYKDKPGYEIHERVGDAAAEMRKSKFCLCPSGSGWGIRLVQAMSNGCIPVIIQDQVHQPGDDVLNYAEFSLRVPRADVPILDKILDGIGPEQLAAMQHAVRRLHRLFMWNGGEAYDLVVKSLTRRMYQILSKLD